MQKPCLLKIQKLISNILQLKCDIFSYRFFLTVMSATRKVDWKLVKKIVNSKKLSLATEEDVLK